MKIGGISGLMRQLLMLLMAICFIHNSGAVGLYSPQTVIKCEDDPTDFDINCFPDHVYILSAFFGRDDSTTCTTASTAATTTMCSTTPANAGSAVSWMNDIFTPMCNGQTTCNLAMANVNAFASSTECAGVYKFLRVTYMCITPGDTNPTPKPTTVAINQQPATTQQLNPLSAETCTCDIAGDPVLINYKAQALGLASQGVFYVSVFNSTVGVNCFFRIRAQIYPTGAGVYQILQIILDLDSGTSAVIKCLPTISIQLGGYDHTGMGVGTTETSGDGKLSLTRLGPNEVELFSGVSWNHCPFRLKTLINFAAPNTMYMSMEISKAVFGDGVWGLCGNCDINNYSYMTMNQTMTDFVNQYLE